MPGIQKTPNVLLNDPTLPATGDVLSYGEVVALNSLINDQLVDADLNHRPVNVLLERKAALQAENPQAFTTLSQAAIQETF